jgi:uncharacterized protein (TIGR00251 family)
MNKNHRQEKERIFSVWLQPRASQNQISGFREEFLRIRVTAPPSGGKANDLLRELLAEALGVSICKVEILSGHKARRKRVRVMGVSPANLNKLGKDPEGNL